MSYSFSLNAKAELRILELEDAGEIFALTEKNRKYLRDWLPWVDRARSIDDTRNFIQTTRDQFASNNGFQTAIFLDGSAVGLIGYHWISWENRLTSLGYWLAQDIQGRGLMSLACQKLVAHAFDNYHLNRVEIRCATQNRKSRAIPERLGFTHEGTIREAERMYDGKFVDHEVYGILKSDPLPSRT